MLGLMFIVGIGGLVLLVALAMWGAGRISLRAGQSETVARRWKYGVRSRSVRRVQNGLRVTA